MSPPGDHVCWHHREGGKGRPIKPPSRLHEHKGHISELKQPLLLHLCSLSKSRSNSVSSNTLNGQVLQDGLSIPSRVYPQYIQQYTDGFHLRKTLLCYSFPSIAIYTGEKGSVKSYPVLRLNTSRLVYYINIPATEGKVSHIWYSYMFYQFYSFSLSGPFSSLYTFYVFLFTLFVISQWHVQHNGKMCMLTWTCHSVGFLRSLFCLACVRVGVSFLRSRLFVYSGVLTIRFEFILPAIHLFCLHTYIPVFI